MSPRVATWNLQRNNSGGALADCERIIGENPDTYFCLQEVTSSMKTELSRILYRDIIHADENMIVSPAGSQVGNPQVLHFGKTTRSFLQVEIPVSGGVYMLLTGKLKHGISFVERYKALRDMYRLYGNVPSIFALDGNHVIPGEFNVASMLLRKYGFCSTYHPEGTHDMNRLEGGKPFLIPTILARSQLDRIFYSKHFNLNSSQVISGVISSDHEPVIAHLTQTGE